LVDSVKSMMMHGLANPEFKKLVLLYVTYPWRTLGTSWCILLKKKILLPSTTGLHRRRFLYPCWPVWANILLALKEVSVLTETTLNWIQ